jgi:hypothetical protein
MSPLSCRVRVPLAALVLLLATAAGSAEDDGWTDLSTGAEPLSAWEAPTGDWTVASAVEVDPQDAGRLTSKAGRGILVNGPKGRAPDLLTKEMFADVEVHVEFFIPKGSNSGVKLMGLYEVQIYDSYGVREPTGADCGGIYPRAEEEPRYHHLDKGVPPRTNAARPAGEWQKLDIAFRAPHFDDQGRKTAPARFVKVVLNGTTIHEGVEVQYPTGSAWRLKKEVASGPLLLQGDHGPVAFRNVRVRPLPAADK